jgi:hypothetical protein
LFGCIAMHAEVDVVHSADIKLRVAQALLEDMEIAPRPRSRVPSKEKEGASTNASKHYGPDLEAWLESANANMVSSQGRQVGAVCLPRMPVQLLHHSQRRFLEEYSPLYKIGVQADWRVDAVDIESEDGDRFVRMFKALAKAWRVVGNESSSRAVMFILNKWFPRQLVRAMFVSLFLAAAATFSRNGGKAEPVAFVCVIPSSPHGMCCHCRDHSRAIQACVLASAQGSNT